MHKAFCKSKYFNNNTDIKVHNWKAQSICNSSLKPQINCLPKLTGSQQILQNQLNEKKKNI